MVDVEECEINEDDLIKTLDMGKNKIEKQANIIKDLNEEIKIRDQALELIVNERDGLKKKLELYNQFMGELGVELAKIIKREEMKREISVITKKYKLNSFCHINV